MSAPRRIALFISSPGDVIAERMLVEQAVERLRSEFANHFELETIRWEERPLTAADHFQAQIPDPATADLVVVILWWHLGTPLKGRQGWGRDWTGPISGREVTGTEWEFENALAGYRETGRKPFILVFQKTSIPTELTEAQIYSYREEKERVVDFFGRWFRDGDSGAYVRAWREFRDAAEFEEMIDGQLIALLRERIDPGDEDGAIDWHESPFRGLAAYDVGDAAIFFGRTRGRHELRALAERRAAAGTPWTLVVGASGSGKSSLVRAGLLPDLRKPGLVPGVGLCRYVILRPGGPADDPVGALARALLGDSALPELRNLRYTEERLSERLAAGDDRAAFAIEQGLTAAGEELSEHYRPMLAVVVDQLEELFRLPEERQAELTGALEAIATAADVWIVATLRSDFLRELDRHRLGERFDSAGRHLLGAPTEVELRQIITRPARAAGLRFGVDDATGESLDEVLLAAARRDPASLPLLGYVLEQLWLRRGDRRVLGFEAYRELGGLEGGIAARAEEVFQALPAAARAALPTVLRRLVSVGQGEEALPVAETASLDRFPADTPERAVVDAMLAPEARLVTAGDGGTVRITHEAVLTHWQRAADQLAEDRRDLQLHGRLRDQAHRWRAAEPEERPSLLLGAGLPLSEAEDLHARRSTELDPGVVALIQSSSREHRERREAELAEARTRAAEAEWRQLVAEKLERRAAAEEYFARAAQSRIRADAVEAEEWRTDSAGYAALLRRRADELEREGGRALSTAYQRHLEIREHPGAPAAAGRPVDGGRIFSLEVLASRHGPCFLIHYGETEDPRLAIVDGGVRGTFRRAIRPALETLLRRRGGGELPIELVVISHYHANAVGGIAQLLEHLAETGRRDLRVRRLWYNNFESILPPPPPGSSREELRERSFKEALRDRSKQLGIPINEPFDHFVMPAEIGPAQVTLPGGLRVTVVAPPAQQVRKWYREWTHDRAPLDRRIQLEEAVAEHATSPELTLIRRPPVPYEPPLGEALDRHASNLSSVVLHLEYQGRTMLLTGDSRADFMMSGLFDAWLLDPDRGMSVDLLTLPHAGCRSNVSQPFFEQVRADRYVVVPQSRTRLPHAATLEQLIAARPEATFTLHFGGYAGDLEHLLARLGLKRLLQSFRVELPDQPDASMAIDLLDPIRPVTAEL